MVAERDGDDALVHIAHAAPGARGLYYSVGFRKFTQDAPLVETQGQSMLHQYSTESPGRAAQINSGV
ncbi:hypothetical protein BEK98_31880 [Streptomyces diastatochromogenes]|uniref:Uncharacterized protein n=1 Tax=Streptomyces diastatochromogenes TaxID=42236 RepID=A0A233S5I5_STRDA|nr:hypothetical protein BEK98_31880 [Streptomyces diastatochromogenes]